MAKRILTTRKSPPKDNENLSIHDTPAEFVRMKKLTVFTTLSQSTIWRKVRANEFPQPIKLSEAVTAWKTSDVRVWIKNVGNDSALETTGANS